VSAGSSIQPLAARRNDRAGRGALAVSTGSGAAPLIRDPAVTPQRVLRALAGFFPGLVSATKFFLGAGTPRSSDRDGGGARRRRPRITFTRLASALSSFNFFQGFSIRLFKQDAESDDGIFYGDADVDRLFVSRLRLLHANSMEKNDEIFFACETQGLHRE
jgi:hypothetical protein